MTDTSDLGMALEEMRVAYCALIDDVSAALLAIQEALRALRMAQAEALAETAREQE